VAAVVELGNRFRLVATAIDVVAPDEPLPKLPVARALWVPRPSLKVAAAAWIHAGSSHHTAFSRAVSPQHLQDFADMADVEFVLIDEETRLRDLQKELRWNEAYYLVARGL
jgi:L-arabinose isomerase